VSKGRFESFSDGVIAVAITLLVLNIDVPAPNAKHTLLHELLALWPAYAAYATSFVTIGIIWINHHVMIGRLRRPDHAIMMLNLLLLMTIGILPFATHVMAEYLRQRHGQKLAAGVYAGSYLAMGIAFGLLNRHILFSKAHLLIVELSLEERRRIFARTVSGLAPYALATVLAAVSPYVTLAICAALAAFYATPLASSPESEQSSAAA
jgi:uncharacterized membrane protein